MITLTEFNDYLRNNRPNVIIYNDANNGDYIQGYARHKVCQASYINLIFSEIIADIYGVTLKNKNGYITLRNIEKISLKKNATLGDIATIYCKNDDIKIAYTIILRKC